MIVGTFIAVIYYIILFAICNFASISFIKTALILNVISSTVFAIAITRDK